MRAESELRVAFLSGSDNASARLAVESVCQLPGVVPVALLLDTEQVGVWRRFKNLRKNIRRNGWTYLPFRIAKSLRAITDKLADRSVVSASEVRLLLKQAFPARCFTLCDLGEKYGFQLISAGNLNSQHAVDLLNRFQVDLGILLGTRLLKESIFSVPRMGCINLHKGLVPKYRGFPPGFWELYEGAPTAGVTVHFVDKGLDTGDVVATSKVAIRNTDTPVTLRHKLDMEGPRTLAAAVAAIQAGNYHRHPQAQDSMKPRTKPTLKQMSELKKRLPHWKQRSDLTLLCKNLHCLFVYYIGLYSLARVWHRAEGNRGAVIFYHRVNDFSKDMLTVDAERFAAQLLAIAKRYHRMSTSELVEHVRQRRPITPTSVVIHFDDCYRDVHTNAAPILAKAEFPPTAFLSLGFIGTERRFLHDQKYPFDYENLKPAEVLGLIEMGFEIGSHTVNHADLGTCPLDEATFELTESRRQLEAVTGRPIRFLAFPFGRAHNIREEIIGVVERAGYAAMFAANGGFVAERTDPYDIPRLAGNEAPLYLLLSIEGVTFNQLFSRLRTAGGGRGKPTLDRSSPEPASDCRGAD